MSAGKGDTPRPVDAKKYGENYDRIFKRGINRPEEKPYTFLDAIAKDGCQANIARPK